MNHISFVIPGIDKLGGAERQAILLAKGLVQRNWRVSMVALTGNGGDTAAELARSRVEFLTLRMRKGLADPRGWIRFHRWVRQNATDVLHTHLPHAAWMARGSRLLMPVRVVIDTVHTSSTGSAGRRALYRITRRLSDRVTAVSRGVADACTAAGLASHDCLLVLPNGIDIAEWKPGSAVRTRMRAELGLHEEFLWCAAGRLEPVKDYPTLLRAFAGLPDSPHLVIAGDGTQQDKLRTLAEELGIAHRIHFLGFQSNVRPWMQAADAFALSSLWEGLPMSLLEAGACGLPCVATDVAGAREIVIDGQTGYIAAPGDAESLGRAMTRLMRMRPENRQSMGLDARQRVAEHYSLGAVLDEWENLYRDLLTQNPRPRRYATLPNTAPLSSVASAR